MTGTDARGGVIFDGVCLCVVVHCYRTILHCRHHNTLKLTLTTPSGFLRKVHQLSLQLNFSLMFWWICDVMVKRVLTAGGGWICHSVKVNVTLFNRKEFSLYSRLRRVDLIMWVSNVRLSVHKKFLRFQ